MKPVLQITFFEIEATVIVLLNVLSHVRFPWQRDVGALSRNDRIVQHCCVSLATQQLKRRAYQKQHCCARDNSHGYVCMVMLLLSSNFD
jgi:hypothetical protein